MNGRNLTIALILVTVLLTACGPSPVGGASLEGTEWVLVMLDGDPPLAGTVPSAEFSADQINGSTGCNHFFGAYDVTGSDITFGPLGMTEMYCMDPEGVMDQEQGFMAGLASAASYRVTGTRLELLDGTGSVILAFEPPPAVPELSLEGTEWVLTTFIEGEAASSTLNGTEITLQLEGGQASGSGGCNSYSGPYSLEGGRLRLTQVSITEMGCLEPAGVLEQEAQYVGILWDVTSYELDGNQLTLSTEAERGLMFAAR